MSEIISGFEIDDTFYDLLATPKPHEDELNSFGGGTNEKYGHVKLSDNYIEAEGSAAESVAASSKAVCNSYNNINAVFKSTVGYTKKNVLPNLAPEVVTSENLTIRKYEDGQFTVEGHYTVSSEVPEGILVVEERMQAMADICQSEEHDNHITWYGMYSYYYNDRNLTPPIETLYGYAAHCLANEPNLGYPGSDGLYRERRPGYKYAILIKEGTHYNPNTKVTSAIYFPCVYNYDGTTMKNVGTSTVSHTGNATTTSATSYNCITLSGTISGKVGFSMYDVVLKEDGTVRFNDFNLDFGVMPAFVYGSNVPCFGSEEDIRRYFETGDVSTALFCPDKLKYSDFEYVINDSLPLASGDYILSGNPIKGYPDAAMTVTVDGVTYYDRGEGVTFNVPNPTTVSVSAILDNDYHYKNDLYMPMIRSSHIEDGTFEPYSKSIDERFEELKKSIIDVDAINEASGSPIVITDSADGALTDFKLYGRSTQKQYTGKNLMPTTTIEGTGYKSVNVSLPAGTYTITAIPTSSDTDHTKCLFLFVYTDGTYSPGLVLTRGIRNGGTITATKEIKAVNVYAAETAGGSSGDTFTWKDIQIESGNVATEFEPYVGGLASPNPDYPQDIISVADKGWFDGELLQGYRNSNNEFVASASYVTNKNLIPCNAGDVIKLTYHHSVPGLCLYFFDNEEKWVTQSTATSNKSELTYTAPNNAKWFSFIVNEQDITPATAKHITVTINDTYAITVKSIGKNLMPFYHYGTSSLGVSFTYNTDGSITCNGTSSGLITWASLKRPTLAHGKYILTGSPSGSSSTTYNLYVYQILDGVQTLVGIDLGQGGTFTAVEGAIYFYCIVIRAGQTVSNLTFYPMVRPIDTDSAYEPYKEEMVIIPLGQPLRSIENLKDELTCIDGKYGIIRRVGSKKYNASEFIDRDSTNDIKYFRLSKPSDCKSYGTWSTCKLLCNISVWRYITEYDSADNIGTINAHGGAYYYAIGFPVDTTLEEVQALGEIEVVYPLAQEVFEPFDEQEMFDNITTYNSTTTLFATDNPEMWVEYYSNSNIGQRLAKTNEEMRAEHSALYNTIKTTVGYIKKNLLPNTGSNSTQENITITKNNDGTLTINGSCTNDFAYMINSSVTLEAGTYILNGNGTIDNYDTRMVIFIDGKYYEEFGRGVEFTLTSKQTGMVYMIIDNAYTYNNTIYKPMIRRVEITDDTYEPYVEDVNTRFNELQTTLSNMGAVYNQTVDLSDTSTYSEDTWYPCVGDSIPVKGFHKIKVAVELNSGTKPSWSTHQNGFTCHMDLLVKACGWGTTNAESICLDYSCLFTNGVNPCGYYQITSTSQPVLWLRGGGKYFVTTDYDCSWTPKTASFTTNGLTLAPTTTERDVYFLTKSTIHANLNANKVDIKYSNVDALTIERNDSANAAGICFKNSNGLLGSIGMTQGIDTGLYRWKSDYSASYQFLDTGNYTSYTVGKSIWTATTKGLIWSRICQIYGGLNAITGFSGLLNVRATRGSMVANATFLINAAHAGSNLCNITQLNSGTYSSFRIRAVSSANSTTYIELYDEAASIASGTIQQWFCSWIPLCECGCTVYTAFTDGTTVPSGYVAQTPVTVVVGKVIQTGALYVSDGVVLDNTKAYIIKNTSGSGVSLVSMNSSNQITLGNPGYQTYLDGSTIFFGGHTVMPNNSAIHCQNTTSGNVSTLYMTASNEIILGNVGYSVRILGSSVSISGLTASMTELNYCKGVTSAIQTQLNGKSPTNHTHTAATLTPNAFATPAYVVSMGASGHSGGLGYTTIAQLKTTLGLGSAAYTNSTAYAPTTHSHTSLALNNNSALTCKNTSGTAINSLYMNTSNQLCIGAGASRIHYGTHGTTTRMQLFASSRIDLCINCNGTSDTVPAVSMIYETIYDQNAGASSTKGTVLRSTSTSNYACLGSSQYPFYSLYYQYMTKSSDRNLKTDIENLSNKYISLWDKLEPKSYHFINNTNSLSLGLIAQDVESAAQESGLSLSDCGFISKAPLYYDSEEGQVQKVNDNGEPEYRYGLDYTFVSILNLAKLKETASKVNALETQVAELLEQINILKNNI